MSRAFTHRTCLQPSCRALQVWACGFCLTACLSLLPPPPPPSPNDDKTGLQKACKSAVRSCVCLSSCADKWRHFFPWSITMMAFSPSFSLSLSLPVRIEKIKTCRKSMECMISDECYERRSKKKKIIVITNVEDDVKILSLMLKSVHARIQQIISQQFRFLVISFRVTVGINKTAQCTKTIQDRSAFPEWGCLILRHLSRSKLVPNSS